MSRWAFVFLLWYICVLFTQPQNRFLFLHPLHIADICIVMSLGLHGMSAMSEGRPLIRMGPGTVLGLFLVGAGLLSQYAGALQTYTGWNGFIDQLMKSALVLIMVEAMAFSVQRVWAVTATMLVATLWWIKAGLRLSAVGATYAGDRIMGPAVSLVENPNAFAYMLCVFLPVYLYFYQQYHNKYVRLLFLAGAIASIYIAFQTGSRTGMLQLIMVGAFVVPKYFFKHKVALTTAAVSTVILFSSVGVLNVQRFKSIPDSIRAFLSDDEEKPVELMNQDEQSAYERRMKNKHTWELVRAYPLFGAGMNPDESKYPEGLWGAHGQVHNELLMAGKQMGLVGMALYLAALGNIYFRGRSIERRAKGWWPALSDLGWTYKLQAVVFFVGGMFSPLPWNSVLFVTLGCTSSLWTQVEEMEVPSVADGAAAGGRDPGFPVPSHA